MRLRLKRTEQLEFVARPDNYPSSNVWDIIESHPLIVKVAFTWRNGQEDIYEVM